MDRLAPSSRVTSLPEHSEVHFWITGLWDTDGMKQFVVDLNKAAWPLTKLGRPIHVLGEMDGFVPQVRETGKIISDHLAASQPYGLTRVANCNASPLVKSQYRRLSAGLDVEFFEDRAEALRWLRRPYDKVAKNESVSQAPLERHR